MEDNGLIIYKEKDFDYMVGTMIDNEGDLQKTVTAFVKEGYSDKIIQAFFSTIHAIKDKLLSENEKNVLVAIKLYAIMRINVLAMPDVVSETLSELENNNNNTL